MQASQPSTVSHSLVRHACDESTSSVAATQDSSHAETGLKVGGDQRHKRARHADHVVRPTQFTFSGIEPLIEAQDTIKAVSHATRDVVTSDDAACAAAAAIVPSHSLVARENPFLNFAVNGAGGQPFSLIILHKLLTVTDFAQLYGSCRTLRTEIGQNRWLHIRSQRTRTVCSSTLLRMSECTWVRSYFIELFVNMRPSTMQDHPCVKHALAKQKELHRAAAAATKAAIARNKGFAGSQAAAATTAAVASTTASMASSTCTDPSGATCTSLSCSHDAEISAALLRAASEPFVSLVDVATALTKFPRLTRLGLQMYKHDAAEKEQWKEAFAKLPRLRALHLLTARVPEVNAAAAVAAAALAAAEANAPPVGIAGGIAPETPAAAAAGYSNGESGVMVPIAVAAAQAAAAMVAAAAAAPAVPVAPPGEHDPTAAQWLLMEIAALQELDILTLANIHERPSMLDFSRLPMLPNLAHVAVQLAPHPRASRGASCPSLFQCTPAQAKALSECTMLTSLRCGAWSRPWYEPEEARWALNATPKGQRMLKAGIGTLVFGKNRDLRRSIQAQQNARAALTSSSQSMPRPTAAPLLVLHLDGTLISSAVWHHISQSTSLTSLAPMAWYADMTQADFDKLEAFRNLRSFALTTLLEETEADCGYLGPLTASRFLPGLLHCSQLQSLHLASVYISTQQLEAIVAAFPQLRHLSFRALRVESLEPLTKSPRLQQFSLHFCTQGPPLQPISAATSTIHDTVFATSPAVMSGFDTSSAVAPTPSAKEVLNACGSLNFRLTIPRLPMLRQLLLHERVRITSEEAAPLNAVLMVRLPILKEKNFFQNLLA
jgi:hypothetical protein